MAPASASERGSIPMFAENALAAFVTALALGAPRSAAAAAIAAAAPAPGRFEVVARHPDVAVDYAAHTPDALARTIDTARALTRGKLTVVFGAGGNRDRAKRPSMGAGPSEPDTATGKIRALVDAHVIVGDGKVTHALKVAVGEVFAAVDQRFELVRAELGVIVAAVEAVVE